MYFYTSGYRLKKENLKSNIEIKKTGMISAKSIPEGASVYLDDELLTATNGTLSGIDPKIHTIRIVKKGFQVWEKQIEVFPELVTDITAILVSQSPRLEPLTNTGAYFPSMSPTLSKLAYFSKDSEEPGVWISPLSQGGLSLFKTTPFVVLKDSPLKKYSTGKSIEWSPDEKNILIQSDNNVYYLIDLQKQTAQSTLSATSIRKAWDTATQTKRQDFVEKLDIPENIKILAISQKSIWSPDDKKFLYTAQTGDTLEYRVYNMEKPIPVGEKVENTVFTTNIKDPQPKISWYSDSFHLILTEADIEKTNTGKISLIRIDGTNKTEVYNNTLLSDIVYSAPSGDKIIIMTSFKSGSQADLYTVSIR